MNQIIIKSLKVDSVIGILASEKETAQELEISVVLETDFSDLLKVQDLKYGVDYSQVVKEIRHFCSNHTHELLETFANELSQHLLKTPNVKHVTLEVYKTQAISNCDRVGILIRSDSAH